MEARQRKRSKLDSPVHVIVPVDEEGTLELEDDLVADGANTDDDEGTGNQHWHLAKHARVSSSAKDGKRDEQTLLKIPRAFLCPLTMDIMYDPVLDVQGRSYERRALLQLVRDTQVTGASFRQVERQVVVPNIALRDTIHEFMGRGWVSKKEAQQRRKNETNASSSSLDISPETVVVSPLRGIIDYFLQHMHGPLANLNLHLNDEGCCSFHCDGITVVLDVPEDAGIFCLYTKNLIPKKVDASLRGELNKRALELNLLQVATLGGCLSVRQHSNGERETVFSFSEKIADISATTFSNTMTNFLNTALRLRLRLLDDL